MHKWTMLCVMLLCLGAAPVIWADAEEDEYNFAESLFIQPDYESALEEFKTFVGKFPEGKRLGQAKYRVGECYFRLKQFEKAVAAYQDALKSHGDAEDAALGSYNLGRAFLMLQKPAEATQPFADAAAKGEGELKQAALVAQGECLLNTNKVPDAITLYKSFLKDFADSKHKANVLFTLGWAQSASQAHEETIATIQTLIKEFPTYPQLAKAKLILSDAYSATQKYDDVDKLLSAMVANKEGGEDVLLRLAWNQFQSGNKEQAGVTFMQFAKTYPDSILLPTALYNAGIALYDIKQFEKAAEAFTQLSQVKAQSREVAEAPLWLGLCHYELKQFDKAVATFKPLLDKEGLDAQKQGSLYYNYAESLVGVENYDEAIVWYDKLIKALPDSKYVPNAWYALSLAKQKKDDIPGAIVALESLLKAHPDTALKPQAQFALAEYYYRQKQPEKALEPLKALAGAEQAEAKVLYRLGWVQFDLKTYPDSQATFERLATMDSAFKLEAIYMAGSSAEQQKQNDKALAHYETLKAAEGDDTFIEMGMARMGLLLSADKATAHFDAYKTRFPKGANLGALKLRLAENAFDAGKVDEAVAHYQALLAMNISPALNESANYGLGWCHFKQEKFDDADKFYAALNAKELTTEMRQDALLKRGEIAYRQEKYKEAKGFFVPLTSLESPRAERALYMAGWSSRWNKEADDAVTYFSTLIEKYPESTFYVDAAMRLSEGHNAKGNHAAAKDLLAKTSESKADKLTEEFYHLYANTLLGAQAYKDVLTIAKQAVEKFPESKKAYVPTFQMGLAAKALGAYDDAEKHFKATMAKTETIEAAKAQFNIAAGYYAQQQYVQAAKQFLRVEMLYDYKELSAKALYHSADAFIKGGDSKRAGLYAKKLVQTYPDTEWGKKGSNLKVPEQAQ